MGKYCAYCANNSSKRKEKKSEYFNNCNCQQKFYIPLPVLTYPPKSEQNANIPKTWMSPGLVENCCTQCSSVKSICKNSNNHIGCGYCSSNLSS